MAKQMKQDMFFEVKEKVNTLFAGKGCLWFKATAEETLKAYDFQVEKFYDKKIYKFTDSQKLELVEVVKIYQTSKWEENQILEGKFQKRVEESIKEQIQNSLNEEEENKQKIQKFIEENKGKDVDWDSRKFNLIALENDKHFNENENAIFWQVSEDLVKDMIKVLLPNEDKPYHKNLTKLLWTIKYNQKAGVKFKNANFDWTVLVHQWKTPKGY
jgi:hypothetical protein